MPWSFVVIEFLVYALAIVLLRHAHQQGWRWVSTCAWAMVFGLVVELSIVLTSTGEGQHYVYGQFWLMVGPEGKEVPVWVGVGWGAIVYAASFTAQRLRAPFVLRPAIAGVLAVNVDLSLDPIAEQLGYWNWYNVDPINLYGVPLDNFLGWFLIVSSFSLCARQGFRWIKPGTWGSDVWVPPLAGLAALLIVVIVQKLVGHVYALPYGQLTLFVLVFMAASAITWGFALKSRRDNAKNWAILSVPLTMHSTLLFILFATGGFETEASLMVFIPMNLLVGFFAYAWASIETLFPVVEAAPAAAEFAVVPRVSGMRPGPLAEPVVAASDSAATDEGVA